MLRLCLMTLGFILAGANFGYASPITLTVYDIDGNPAPGSDVYCVPWEDYGCRTEALPEGSHQVTNKLGQAIFDIDGVNDFKQYIIYAHNGKFSIADRLYPSREGEAKTAELHLNYAQRITGTIRDQQGEPLEGVQILGLSTIPLGVTGPDGTYAFYNTWGATASWVYKPGYTAVTNLGLDNGIYNLILSKGTAYTGIVLWSDGQPASGVEVHGGRFRTVTNKEGEFQLPHFYSDREVRIQASINRPGQKSLTAAVQVAPQHEVAVELRMEFSYKEAMIDKVATPAPPQGFVYGQVTDKKGKPIEATILRKNFDSYRDELGKTDEQGIFKIPLAIDTNYEIIVEPKSSIQCMMGSPKKVRVKESESIEANFSITEAASIRGTLLDSAGNPLQRQWVRLQNGGHEFMDSHVNESGRFSFPHIPITGNPITLSTRFRGQTEDTQLTLPPLTPRERRSKIEFKAPTAGGARLNHPSPADQIVLAVYHESSPPPPAPRLDFAQAKKSATIESAKPNFVPVRIKVADENGGPFPNASLHFKPSLSSGTSGEDGEIITYIDWTGPRTWEMGHSYLREVLYIDGHSNHLSEDESLEILEANLHAETPEDLLNFRVVAKRPDWQVVWGKVQLEDRPSENQEINAHILNPNTRRESDEMRTRGEWFMQEISTSSPDETTTVQNDSDLPPSNGFALEFTANGYIPKILAEGVHFSLDDAPPLMVTLKRGPIHIDISAWTAVTGQPAKQAVVDQFPAGIYIRTREREYRQIASTPPKVQAPVQAANHEDDIDPLPAPPYAIRIMNAAGEALDHIYYHSKPDQFDYRHSYAEITTMPPRLDRPYEFLKAENGVFNIPQLDISLWSEGLGFHWLAAPENESDIPKEITLYPTSQVTIIVQDADGKPIPEAAVGSLSLLRSNGFYPSNNKHLYTDEQGVKIYEHWPAGRHTFAVTSSKEIQNTRAFDLILKPGESVIKHITLGPWPEGSPEATLLAWKNTYRWIPYGPPWRIATIPNPAEDLAVEIANLSKAERKAIEDEVILRIQESPLQGRIQNEYKVDYLSQVAVALELKEVIPYLKMHLEVPATKSDSPHQAQGRFSTKNGSVGSTVASAITKLAPDKAVPYFKALAQHPTISPYSRMLAVIELGVIGTEESIAAWRELRDAALKNNKEHLPKDDYTHAEKMAEGVAVTLYGIPFSETQNSFSPLERYSATVEEDYSYGTIQVGSVHSGSTTYGMRRFGSDWVVVWLGDTIIS